MPPPQRPSPYGTGIGAPGPAPKGSQYGPDGELTLEDLGNPNLSPKDQYYLAGLGVYYNPQDAAARDNYAKWQMAMEGGGMTPAAPQPTGSDGLPGSPVIDIGVPGPNYSGSAPLPTPGLIDVNPANSPGAPAAPPAPPAAPDYDAPSAVARVAPGPAFNYGQLSGGGGLQGLTGMMRGLKQGNPAAFDGIKARAGGLQGLAPSAGPPSAAVPLPASAPSAPGPSVPVGQPPAPPPGVFSDPRPGGTTPPVTPPSGGLSGLQQQQRRVRSMNPTARNMWRAGQPTAMDMPYV